jgi:hypothetical protein
MSTTTQTPTGAIGLRGRISALYIDPDFAAMAVFSALGLLASLFFVSHFPLSVEDAKFLASYL